MKTRVIAQIVKGQTQVMLVDDFNFLELAR